MRGAFDYACTNSPLHRAFDSVETKDLLYSSDTLWSLDLGSLSSPRSTKMPSVRQKKAGIRAVSSTPEGSAAAAASAATPVLSTDVPQAVSRPQRSPKPTLPKVPATAAVVGSARNKGKRSPSATPTTTVARSGGIASSPTQTRLIGGHTDNR